MTEQYLVKPDTANRNLHRARGDGEPPCGATGSNWQRVTPEDVQNGDCGLCRNESCFGGDTEDPIEVDVGGECVDCGGTGDGVMQREVGRRTMRLCAECAAERRRLSPPSVVGDKGVSVRK